MLAGNDPAAKLAEAIDEARAAVQENKRHLVSVGFVGWVLDKFNTTADPRLATVLEKQPAAVWFAFGDDLGKYVAQVHAHNASHGTKIVIFVNTNTVAEALRAANEWKADVIVVQGRLILPFSFAADSPLTRGRSRWSGEYRVAADQRFLESRP